MKRFLRGLGLVLALVMVLAMPARADLLSERMEAAYAAGRQVEAAVSVQLGSGGALFLPQETFGAVQKLLSDTRIVTRWAKDEAGMPVVGLEIAIQDVKLLQGEALMTGDSAQLTASWLPGKTLALPLSSLSEVIEQQPLPVQLDEQTAALLMQSGERYLGVVMGWVQQNQGMVTANETGAPATDVRSATVRSDRLVVSAAQLKDLLVQLADAFEQDADLQAMLGQYLSASGQTVDVPGLAQSMAQAAQNLVPLDGALQLDMYQDDVPETVGMELTVDPLFEGMSQAAFAQYDRLDEDGYVSHAVQGRLGLENGGMAATKISYSVAESHVEPTIDTDLLVRGMIQNAESDPISQITLTDVRHTVQGDDQERIEDALTLSMEQLAPDGSAAEGAMPMAVVLNTASVTNAESGGDFASDTTATLSFMGMELGAVAVMLTSGEYAPQDISGNTVVDLSKATDAEQQALLQELQTGMTQALMSAMAVLPPELLSLMQGG